jgi:hypothetical protein
MPKKTRVYRAEDILRRVQAVTRELAAMRIEIDKYLAEVEQRRVDNRSTIEEALKGSKHNGQV